MFETVTTSFLAWLMFAAASYRFRRDLGLDSPRIVTALRVAATAVLLFALLRCGAPVSGERWVRFLGGAAVSAVIVVALLSVAPLRRPVRAPR